MRVTFAFVATLAVMLGSSVPARADYVSSVLGCEGDPCVVKGNLGGRVRAFEAAAREIKRTGRRIVIDGPCASACAILADRVRSKVCVTANAKFGFHKAALVRQYGYGGPVKIVRRFDPSHSRDIAGWVRKRGGFPTRGVRVMGASEARRIWRAC